MSKGKLLVDYAHGVDGIGWGDLTLAERLRVKQVNCGPDCEYCDDTYKRGICVITELDAMGDVYPEATTVILIRDEWIVWTLDPDAPLGRKVAATYPKDKVVGIRNLPCEMTLFGHSVLMPEESSPHLIIDGKAGGVPVPATDADLAEHLASTPHSTTGVD